MPSQVGQTDTRTRWTYHYKPRSLCRKQYRFLGLGSFDEEYFCGACSSDNGDDYNHAEIYFNNSLYLLPDFFDGLDIEDGEDIISPKPITGNVSIGGCETSRPLTCISAQGPLSRWRAV